MKNMVEDITDNMVFDKDKVDVILQWFDRGIGKQENIANFYYRLNQEDIIVLLYAKIIFEAVISTKYPFVSLRLPSSTENWHDWIFHARSGRCGEYARLFMYMCYFANIEIIKENIMIYQKDINGLTN
jgi:hypothetical protein